MVAWVRLVAVGLREENDLEREGTGVMLTAGGRGGDESDPQFLDQALGDDGALCRRGEPRDADEFGSELVRGQGQEMIFVGSIQDQGRGQGCLQRSRVRESSPRVPPDSASLKGRSVPFIASGVSDSSQSVLDIKHSRILKTFPLGLRSPSKRTFLLPCSFRWDAWVKGSDQGTRGGDLS